MYSLYSFSVSSSYLPMQCSQLGRVRAFHGPGSAARRKILISKLVAAHGWHRIRLSSSTKVRWFGSIDIYCCIQSQASHSCRQGLLYHKESRASPSSGERINLKPRLSCGHRVWHRLVGEISVETCERNAEISNPMKPLFSAAQEY